MTYTELQAAVSSALENTFSADDFAFYTRTAEQKIYNAVQIPVLRKNVTGVTTSGNTYLACPNDFISSYSLAVVNPTTGAYTYLIDKDVNYIREAYPVPTATGTPKYYAMFGNRTDAPNELTFILGPTPDAAYAAELHYYFYPESIVTAGSTWLSENYDPVLYHAVVVEAYTAMKGEADLLTAYKTQFVESIAQLKRLGDGLLRQDSYRSGQARVPVN